MASTGVQKEVNKIIGDVRAAGFKVVKGGKHWKVLTPKGQQVMEAGKPVVISQTSSETRVLALTRTRLERAGVLNKAQNPSKNTQAKGSAGRRNNLTPSQRRAEHKRKSSERMRSPEMQAAKVAKIKEIARQRAARTLKIRQRLEPLVVKWGGWREGKSIHSPGVGAKELGEIMVWWGNVHNRVETPKTVNAARSVCQSMKMGGTLGDGYMTLWEMILDEAEAAPDPREWFFNSLRLAKGLNIEKSAPGPITDDEQLAEVVEIPVAKNGKKDERSWHPVVEWLEANKLPTGALQMAIKMARGVDPKDKDEIQEIIELTEQTMRRELAEILAQREVVV